MKWPAWVTADGASPLLEELHWLRHLGLWHIGENAARIPALLALARAHSPAPDASRALAEFLREVVAPAAAADGEIPADILEIYFGVSMVARGLSPQQRRERSAREFYAESYAQFRRPVGAERRLLERLVQVLDGLSDAADPVGLVEDAVLRRSAVVLLVGSDTSPVEVVEPIRELVTIGAIAGTGTTQPELMWHLADLFTTPESWRWAGPMDDDFHGRLTERAAFVVATGLTGDEEAVLDRWRPTLGHVTVVASADLDELLRRLHPDRLALLSVLVDFARPFDLNAAIAGAPVQPGIVRHGSWPGEEPPATGPLPPDLEPIHGAPGTGKTARALRRAWLRSPDATFYLDLATVAEVDLPACRHLLAWLERRHPGASLILDNCQAAAPLDTKVLQQPEGTIHIITVTAAPMKSSNDLPYADDNPDEQARWSREVEPLARWVIAARPVLRLEAERAAADAQSYWHFLYLLRGGAGTLGAELAEAHRSNADVVWYAVASHQFFARAAATLRELHAALDTMRIWPVALDERERGRWLLDRLTGLVGRRHVLARAGRFSCRHILEAVAVILRCSEHDAGDTLRSFRDATVDTFRDRLGPPIELTPTMAEPPERLSKQAVHEFVSHRVWPLLQRQMQLEVAVPFDERAQQHVDLVWAPVTRMVETWPVHPLYWLIARSALHELTPRFPPFHRARTISALAGIRDTSDAIDAEYLIKALMSYGTLRALRRQTRLIHIRHTAAAAAVASSDEQVRRSGAELERLVDAATEPGVLAAWPRLDGTVRSALNGHTLPDETEFGYLIAAALIRERRTGVLAAALEAADAAAIVGGWGAVSARPLLLAHLWLLSPGFGRRCYDAMPPAWRGEVSDAIRTATTAPRQLDRHSAFHLNADEYPFVQFVAEVAALDPGLAQWLTTDDGAELATQVRSARRATTRLRGELMAAEKPGRATSDLAIEMAGQLGRLSLWMRANRRPGPAVTCADDAVALFTRMVPAKRDTHWAEHAEALDVAAMARLGFPSAEPLAPLSEAVGVRRLHRAEASGSQREALSADLLLLGRLTLGRDGPGGLELIREAVGELRALHHEGRPRAVAALVEAIHRLVVALEDTVRDHQDETLEVAAEAAALARIWSQGGSRAEQALLLTALADLAWRLAGEKRYDEAAQVVVESLALTVSRADLEDQVAERLFTFYATHGELRLHQSQVEDTRTAFRAAERMVFGGSYNYERLARVKRRFAGRWKQHGEIDEALKDIAEAVKILDRLILTEAYSRSFDNEAAAVDRLLASTAVNSNAVRTLALALRDQADLLREAGRNEEAAAVDRRAEIAER